MLNLHYAPAASFACYHFTGEAWINMQLRFLFVLSRSLHFFSLVNLSLAICIYPACYSLMIATPVGCSDVLPGVT